MERSGDREIFFPMLRIIRPKFFIKKIWRRENFGKHILQYIFLGIIFIQGLGCSHDGDPLLSKPAKNSVKVDTSLGKEPFSSKNLKKSFALTEDKREERNEEYLALNRFERPEGRRVKRVASKMDSFSYEAGRAMEKKLIFGGKGFKNRQFEDKFDGRLSIDFHHHINSLRNPPSPLESQDQLELAEDHSRDYKSIVFHKPTTLFNTDLKELTRIMDDYKDELESKTVSIETKEPIPETKVMLDKVPKYLLKLRAKKPSLDLLSGNESANKYRFSNDLKLTD